MLSKLRIPLFVLAAILFVVGFFVEIGSNGITTLFYTLFDSDVITNPNYESRPGIGIPYLAVFDGLLLLTLSLISLSLILPENIHARIQGIITLIVSLIIIISAILLLISAFTKLLLMVGLLLAAPFGTIAYFIMFASFKTASAKVVLGAIMVLKISFSIVLVFAHQRFLENKTLVFIVLTSLFVTLITTLLHSIVPGFLVSITDAVAAIVICIIAIVWGVIYLVSSVISVVKAVA